MAGASGHGRAGPAGRRLSIAPPTSAADAGTVGAGGPVGTIWCEAPPFARFSYWRDDEATAAAWRGDAFTVGDLGHLDAEGYSSCRAAVTT